MQNFMIVGWSLVMGLLFDYFLYDKEPGLSFPIYVILIVAGLWALAERFKLRPNKEVLWLLIPLLFFSAMVFVRASEMLTFLNIVASLILLLLINVIAFRERLKNFQIADYLKIFFLPIRFLQPMFQTASGLLSVRNNAKNPQVLAQVLKGIVITLPILCIFGVLFASADLIFNKTISDLVSLNIPPDTGVRIILIALATLIFTGAYTFSLQGKEDKAPAKEKPLQLKLGQIESSILLGSVNVLFFAFILIQLTYLFGGENTVIAQGFTFAEYARKGFFELIGVAVLSLLLLLTTEKFTNRILSTALIAQVLVIMVSAATRLSLYEAAYGFTAERLFSHAFIFLLAAIFLLLAYKIWIDKRENVFAFGAFVSIILYLATMNLLNPDAFIARQNIARFGGTDDLDISYLSTLSDDAIPQTIQILDDLGEYSKETFAAKLFWRLQGETQLNENQLNFSEWQSFNLSHLRAEKILNSRITELEPYRDAETVRMLP